MRLLERCALELDGRQTTLAEVFAAAHLGGWTHESLIKPVRGGLALAALAKRARFEVSRKELQPALDAWRGANRVHSMEQTEAWMKFHEVELRDLVAYLERQILRSRHASHLEQALRDAAPGEQQVFDTVPLEALFSGRLLGLVDDTAFRLAAGATDCDPKVHTRECEALLDELGIESQQALDGVSRMLRIDPSVAEWLIDLEVRYRLRTRDLLTLSAVEHEIEQSFLPLTGIDYLLATFPSEAAAREAVCCVREDGETLDIVARRSRAPTMRDQQLVMTLEKLPFGPMLIGAVPGEVIGPTVTNRGHAVHQVLARLNPTVEDAAVRKIVDKRIIERNLRPEIAQRVRFVQLELAVS